MIFDNIIIKPAKKELIDAVAFYNEQLPGLGYEFSYEVNKAIERIINFPETYPKISGRARKCRCKRFPYNIIYYIYKSSIVIVAIMHNKRKPYYWMERLK